MSSLVKNNMSKLYFEALTEAEKKEFPKLGKFKKSGVLVGGTALALQFGHRRSYDFDIFFLKPLLKTLPYKARSAFGKITVLHDFEEELSFITSSGAKITFVYYPFPPLFSPIHTNSIGICHWKDIALDKAYTIGRRAQYRDYVDMFFFLEERKLNLNWIIKNAEKKFGGLFSEKLFLSQLIYLADLRNLEVEFLKEKHIPKDIKTFFEKAVEQYTQNFSKKK